MLNNEDMNSVEIDDEPVDDVYEDPVCGMLVNPQESSFKSRFGGVTYYFCSAECKTKFDEIPTMYVGAEVA